MWHLIPKRTFEPFDNTSKSICLFSGIKIGRQELLETTWAACGCGTTTNNNTSNNNNNSNGIKENDDPTNLCCPYCNPTKEWAMQFIPRKYISVNSNDEFDKMQFCGKNIQQLVKINGACLENVIQHNKDEEQKASVDIQDGMVLRLEYYEDPMHALEFEIVKRQDDDNTEADVPHHHVPAKPGDDISKDNENGMDETTRLSIETRNVASRGDSTRVAALLEHDSPNGNARGHGDRNASERMSTETLTVPLRMEEEEEEATVDDDETQNQEYPIDETADENVRIRQEGPVQVEPYKNDELEASRQPTDSRPDSRTEHARVNQEGEKRLEDDVNGGYSAPAEVNVRMDDVPVRPSNNDLEQAHDDQEETMEDKAEESQMSCRNTQDLMDKIMRDIEDQEKDWPDSQDDEGSTMQVDAATATGVSSDGTGLTAVSTAATTPTTTTCSAAQVVSGDEQAHKNDDVPDSRCLKEKSIGQSNTATVASAPPASNGDDSLSRPVKKRRAQHKSVPIIDSDAVSRPGPKKPASRRTAEPSIAAESSRPTEFRVMFVPLGQECSSNMIRVLSGIARNKGAEVVSSLESNPTHLVVSARVPADNVASKLNFRNAGKLNKFLKQRGIETVKPDWIRGPGNVLTKPTMNVLWNGLAGENLKAGKKKKLPRPSKPKPQPAATRREPYPNNAYLSAMFHKLAKLSQECAMQKSDPFRALTNNLISGRLLQLDFEVTLDNLDKVKQIKGIGDSSVKKMKQCLERGDGKCVKIEEYENDKDRMGMRAMKNIWGVGQAKAAALVRAGYRTIEEVRRGLQDDPDSSVLNFSKNALLGVQYYEDFLERMPRSEVEAIADTVKNALFERFPKAKVTLMGSYRRGKTECGDIDLLITEPSFVKTTPAGALEELVHRLKDRGHISHHLAGAVDSPKEMNDSQSSYEYQHETVSPPPDPSSGKGTSQSYMGIIKSPVVEGKMRRIDIKFYPYRERVFASLYFTGNGWFNRSMRRWVKRENLSLDDHGLFEVFREKSSARLMRKSNQPFFMASTEREVFDRLGLVYKDPTDRNYFDDVIPKVETPDWDPGAMSENEFHEDSKQHDKEHGGPRYLFD